MSRESHTPGFGRIPDELIDALLDGDLDERMGDEVARAARRHPAQRSHLHDSARAIEALRGPVETPDLTGTILNAAHRRRRFLPASVRRAVEAGRYVAGAVLLLAIGGVVIAQRNNPDWFRLSPPERTLSLVSEAVRTDAAQSAELVTTGVRQVRATLLSMPTGQSLTAKLDAEWNPEFASAVITDDGVRTIVVMPQGRVMTVTVLDRSVDAGADTRWVASASSSIVGVSLRSESEKDGRDTDHDDDLCVLP